MIAKEQHKLEVLKRRQEREIQQVGTGGRCQHQHQHQQHQQVSGSIHMHGVTFVRNVMGACQDVCMAA